MKRICVFLGSNRGLRPSYVEAARRMGRELVKQNIALVYGGTGVGLMAEIADTVLNGGGEAVGIITRQLVGKEIAHPNLTELIVVNSMHERKARMEELSDGFVALPGGLGTLEEICEIATWAQLGLHRKPCGLLDVDGYYCHLNAFLDHMEGEGFIKKMHRSVILSADDPADLIRLFRVYSPPADKFAADQEKRNGGEEHEKFSKRALVSSADAARLY